MTVASDLARLEGSGLIRLATTRPQVEYVFRHALIHEAAYQSLLREDRRALHRAAGEILEGLWGERVEEGAATLAYHFARAEIPSKAVPYQLRAADRAAASYANAEALELYAQALEGAPAAELPRVEVARAYERFGAVLELIGRLDEAVDAYLHALERTDPNGTLDRARLARRQGNAHRIARRVPDARAAFRDATALLDVVVADDRGREWWSERLDLLLDRAWLHYFWGTLDEMAAVLSECATAVDTYASAAQRTRYYARLALLKMRSDHMIVTDEALALGQAAYDAWEATADSTDVELARFQLGFFHLWRGDMERAVQYLEESLRAAELTGDVVLQSRCLIYLAVAARVRGDADEMERIQSRGMQVFTAGGMHEYLAIAAANRAWAAWRRGDIRVARTRASEALDLSKRLPAKYAMDWTARLPLLAMAMEGGDLADAMEQADELVDGQWLAEEYGQALQEARAAYRSGQVALARERLSLVVDQARRRGWL